MRATLLLLIAVLLLGCSTLPQPQNAENQTGSPSEKILSYDSAIQALGRHLKAKYISQKVTQAALYGSPFFL